MITDEEIAASSTQIQELEEQVKSIRKARKKLEASILLAEENGETQESQALSEKSAKLADEIRETRAEQTAKKHELAKAIAETKKIHHCLAIVEEINNALAGDIERIAKTYHELYKNALAEEIRSHYDLPEDVELSITAKDKGESVGFIVEAETAKYYIKESLTFHESKRINPNELFIYKLLEYSHFGPKTEFIIKSFSTSATGAKICYISTKDVAHTKSRGSKFKLFITDNPDDYLNTETAEKEWEKALANKEFCIELLAFSILDDAFYMNDALRTNPSNYGLVSISKENEVRFKPKFIDHLPDCKNIEFKSDSPAHAIDTLKDKLSISMRRRARSRKKPPFSHTIIHREPPNNQNHLAEDTAELAFTRLLKGKSQKAGSDIVTAINRAKEDITDMIAEFPDSFTDEPAKKLESYCKKAMNNINRIMSIIDDKSDQAAGDTPRISKP